MRLTYEEKQELQIIEAHIRSLSIEELIKIKLGTKKQSLIWNKLFMKAPKWTPYKVLLWINRKAVAEQARNDWR
jgi:hypothetical protein